MAHSSGLAPVGKVADLMTSSASCRAKMASSIPAQVVYSVPSKMGRWMPAGMPKVDTFALLMRVDAVVDAVDPEAAGTDPEGPAAALEVEDVEAICRDDYLLPRSSQQQCFIAQDCRMLLLLQSV